MPAPIPEPLVESLLARWPIARLATVAADGRPHLVPVVFARRDGALWSPVDGKPKRSDRLARLRHVEREPRVALLLDRYGADWRELWWIRIDGRAEVVRGEHAAGELRAKYPQYGELPLFRGEPTWLRIAPERLSSWYAGEGALDGLRGA
ncbi:MAG TPA: TIGR03668 family PPOX class F420-dependent oxidoreductase [Myxococcota bacterium]|nr:TIGR03668 family PPOX class F420-dependent oxidoreductase [Myxococcota bacterium]